MNKYEGDMPEATVEIGRQMSRRWEEERRRLGDEAAAKQSALARAGDG